MDYDYGDRILDARIGKWFSTDPVVKPWLSPFQFGANNPVNYVDVAGKDEYHFHTYRFVTETNGVPIAQVRSELIVVRNNDSQDRFYVHTHTTAVRLPTGQHITSIEGERVQEFYPWTDKRSNITHSSTFGIIDNILWGGDRDYVTLLKYTSANSALKADFLRKSKENPYGDYKQVLSDAKIYQGLDYAREGLEFVANALMVYDDLVAVKEIPKWNGPVDYSALDQTDEFAHTRDIGKDFTPSQKLKIKEYNKKMNGGLFEERYRRVYS